MNAVRLLDTITKLSHEFGTPTHVKGGGGNTSCKTPETLWVKPSGTTLGGLSPEKFVALDRAELKHLYELEIPEEDMQIRIKIKESSSLQMKAVKGEESEGMPLFKVSGYDLKLVLQ